MRKRYVRVIARLAAIAFALACLALLISGLPHEMLHEWESREETRLHKRLKFMAETWSNVVKSSPAAERGDVRKRVRDVVEAKENPFDREYLVSSVDGVLYIAEKPEKNETRVCVLDRSGTGGFRAASSDLVVQIVAGADK